MCEDSRLRLKRRLAAKGPKPFILVPMDIAEILFEIDAEIERLGRIRTIVEGLAWPPPRKQKSQDGGSLFCGNLSLLRQD